MNYRPARRRWFSTRSWQSSRMKVPVRNVLSMKLRRIPMILALAIALAAPAGAWAQSLDEAARAAARQYNAKVLSAQTVQEGGRRVHVIKLLTRDGVVKTVRIVVREN